MGKYDDLFDVAPSPTPAAAVGKYSDLFDEPGVVAEQQQPEGGDGFLAKVNAALRKPSPAWLQAPEQATRELVGGMVPHDIPSYLESIYPPAAAARLGANLAQGDVSGLPLVGRVPEIMSAEDTPAGSKERYLTAIKTLMDVGMLAGGGERAPLPLRGEPLATPELPPSPNLGPGTIAGDVSRALERRFTLQDTPPEPPPDLAPAPPIEETLPKVGAPPFNPEAGLGMQVESPMPLQTEGAQQIAPISEALLAPLRKRKAAIEASIAPSKAIGQRTVYDAELEKLNGQLGVPPEGPIDGPIPSASASEASGGVPVADIPAEDVKYAGGEPVPQAFSEEPHVSAIANRFTAERAASGELGEIAPGESVNTMDLVHHGLKMSPEQVNASVSRVMQGGDVPINDVAALRGEEARLSQRSGDLSRAARANPSPEAQLAADNAFKDLTDFHNGPVAQAKRNWHHQGKLMQGEIPVDLSTLNGMREAWLKDTGKPPPAHVEPKLQRVADNLARAIDEERAAARNGGEAIEKATQGRKMPTPEEVRNNIAERMGVEPCII